MTAAYISSTLLIIFTPEIEAFHNVGDLVYKPPTSQLYFSSAKR